MKNNISDILSKVKRSIIREINPIYFKIYLMKSFQGNNFSDALVFKNEIKEIEEFIITISTFLGVIDKDEDLTSLGKFLLFSSNFVEDFYKLLILNDEDFYYFIIDLIENNMEYERLNDEYLSNFFQIVSPSLKEFLISVGLIIEKSIDLQLLNSWERQATEKFERISYQLFNILNKINPDKIIENKKYIIKKFNSNSDLKLIFDDNIKLRINFEEFKDFKEKLDLFFNSLDFSFNIENSIFLDLVYYNPKIKDKIVIDNNRIQKSQTLRSRFLRNTTISIYNECQICAVSKDKIPEIITRDKGIYLEVHHIIPISLQNDIEKWINYYNYNNNFDKYFKDNLDNIKNMISICSHHHTKLHYEYPQWKFFCDNRDEVFFNNSINIIKIKTFKNHYCID